MTTRTFVLLDAQARSELSVEEERDRLCVAASALERSLGWQVKPEGFCRGDECVPAGDAVGNDGQVDLLAFAARLGRPIVVDRDEAVISIGAAASGRVDALQSLQAPDFQLPDLDGQIHALSSYRGKKILLAAYASW